MIDKLEFVLFLAQERHFGRAAEAAGVSQPTLSSALKSLEDQLGVVIVERGSRFRGFTAEGVRVLEWARKLVGDSRTMRQEIEALKKGLDGTLRLAVIPTSLPFVPELTVPLHKRYPGVAFAVQSLTTDSILQRIDNLEADAGITYLDYAPLRRFKVLPLYHERYALIVATTSPLAMLETISWREASRLPLCLLSKDMQNRQTIDKHLEEAGGVRVPMLDSNSLFLLCTHVRSGDWASIMPARFVETLEAPGSLKAIPISNPTVSREVGIVFEKRDLHSPLIEALKKHVLSLSSEPALVPQ